MNVKRMGWRVVGAAFFAVVIISCLRSGLYFSVDIYPVWIGYGVFCLCTGLWGLYRLVSEPTSGLKDMPCFPQFSSFAGCLLLYPFLMMFLYAVHWMTGPLSVQGTVNQVVRWGFYSSFAVTAYYISLQKGGKLLLASAWHTAGALLSITSLLPVYGLLTLPYAIAHTNNPGISATGARLAGLLEYPNTFGAVMATFLLERLFALGPLLRQQPSASRILLNSLPLLPYAAALLLSESRGAWLAAGLACAAGLVQQRRRMLTPLLLAAAPFAGAALLYRQLASAMLAPVPLPGLLELAGLWAGSLWAGLWLLRLRGEAAGMPRRLALAAGGALMTAGAAAVFYAVHDRIVKNFSTVSARGAMYRDAWVLVKDAPWLGQGGDTWRLSYRAVQSHPYVGSQMHSGYLDILLNTGLTGLSLTFIMLAAALILIYRNSRYLMPSFAVIAIHSVADIDWSFGVVWLLLFILAARGTAEPGILQPGNKFHFLHMRKSVSSAILVLWFFITAGSIIIAYRGHMGNVQHLKAVNETSGKKAAALMESSLRWNPADYTTALDLARMLPPAKADAVLRQSLSYNPEHAGLLWALAGNAGKMGDAEAAIFWIQAGLNQDKYNAGEQTRSLECLLQLARERLASGNAAEARYVVQSGLDLYTDYVRTVEYTRRRDVGNDRDYRLTQEAQQWGSQLALLAQSIPGANR